LIFHIIAGYVAELMELLEDYLAGNKKPIFQPKQPPTLYSKAPQEARETTIAKCMESSRGFSRKRKLDG
jgi:hypothetical protein